jgi:hypothetical protein
MSRHFYKNRELVQSIASTGISKWNVVKANYGLWQGFVFLAAGGLLVVEFLLPGPATRSGMPLLRLMGVVAMVPGLTALFSLATVRRCVRKKKPSLGPKLIRYNPNRHRLDSLQPA